jgi:hypothetical protein
MGANKQTANQRRCAHCLPLGRGDASGQTARSRLLERWVVRAVVPLAVLLCRFESLAGRPLQSSAGLGLMQCDTARHL